MNKKKICVVVTARPSYARIKTALLAIKNHPALELQLVVTASAVLNRYGSLPAIMEADGLKPTRQIYMIVEGENLVTSAKSTGLGLSELATAFDDLKPDMVVTIADRFETIATSIAAAYMNIPLVHVQGGEVTGSIDEKTRHANTKLADIHLVANESARLRVERMGEEPSRIFVTGCPSIDVARHAAASAPDDIGTVLQRYGGVGAEIDPHKPYLVVMQHPVTTEFENASKHIEATIDAVDRIDSQVLWYWPNVDAGSDATSKSLRIARENNRLKTAHFYRNMNPVDFLHVLIRSRGIIGNSSVAIRECSYLGVPAINIGSRQNRRDRGRNVIDVGYDAGEITAAIKAMLGRKDIAGENIYGDGHAGERIAEVLARVTPSIEKTITY